MVNKIDSSFASVSESNALSSSYSACVAVEGGMHVNITIPSRVMQQKLG